jgi:predicted DNA-binding protein
MDLTKKTTILLSPDLYEHLTRTARARRKSLGQLVREACEIQYSHVSDEDRLRAVDELRRLSLPVGSPRKMKLESVPRPRNPRR